MHVHLKEFRASFFRFFTLDLNNYNNMQSLLGLQSPITLPIGRETYTLILSHFFSFLNLLHKIHETMISSPSFLHS